MRPIAYDLTPQGFRIPLYDNKRLGDGPDDLVVKSCALLASDRTGETHTWTFQRKIINRGLDLFGDFREFLKAQDTNSSLTTHQRLFLEDTLQFICTGRRSMSLELRATCLAMESEEKSPARFSPSRSTRPLFELYSLPAEDYMYHWISHDRGFTDMVCTLNVIFGDIKNP
ncbi:virion structural protein [Salmonella phage SPLA10]|nr:virion structural protein [Salmonella phage SPLA10]